MKLHDEIGYDPVTGLFHWKRPKQGRKVWYRLRNRSYNRIQVNGVNYLGGRLAWYLIHGYWPKEIDHINGVKNDDRLSNLREVSHSENMRNWVRNRQHHRR